MPYKNPAEKAAWMKANSAKYAGNRLDWEKKNRQETRLSRPFIAVDGEGLTLPDGSHSYVMLCASGGEYIQHPAGLNFEQCVRFLLSLKEKYPTGIFVGFGFNYDVNMIIKSKGLDWIDANLLNAPPDHNGYTLNRELGGYLYCDWKPRKTFALKLSVKADDKKPGMIVYDTLGFFQSSFYRALVDNAIGDRATLDRIETMKRARSTFQESDLTEIREYSLLECRLLVELMDRLRSLIAGLKDTPLALNLPLSRWDGAGAIAAELLKHYGIKEHRWPLDRPNHPGVLNAYFGGRFESPMLGMLRETHSYDINSAYPEAMFWLPCLKDARFERVDSDWDRKSLALCHVRWNLPGDTIIAPFPFRDKSGRISFPVNGAGWYWSFEVTEALLRFGEMANGFGIELLETQRLHTPSNDCDCGGVPFSWIGHLYEYRRELKEVGDARQLPLKLGYNSCYGKLAQGVGHAPFQDFIWAGLTTSYTRGKILAVIYRNNAEKFVAQIATDGIEFTKRMPLTTGDGLGQWEYGKSTNVFIAGNGLVNYDCPKCNGAGPSDCPKCVGRGSLQKVRGFSKGERIEWEALRAAFLKDGPGASIKVTLNRFIGAQLAIHLRDKTMFCRWLTQEKVFTVRLLNRDVRLDWGKVSVETGGRIPSHKREKGKLWLTDPVGVAAGAESYPHRPKSYKGVLESEEDLSMLVDTELSNDD